MSKDTVDSRWMDEHDPELQRGVTCDVELNIENGKTYRDLVAKAAWALRTTAVQIEAGKLDDGFHPIKTLDGEEIGKVYLDYYRMGDR